MSDKKESLNEWLDKERQINICDKFGFKMNLDNIDHNKKEVADAKGLTEEEKRIIFESYASAGKSNNPEKNKNNKLVDSEGDANSPDPKMRKKGPNKYTDGAMELAENEDIDESYADAGKSNNPEKDKNNSTVDSEGDASSKDPKLRKKGLNKHTDGAVKIAESDYEEGGKSNNPEKSKNNKFVDAEGGGNDPKLRKKGKNKHKEKAMQMVSENDYIWLNKPIENMSWVEETKWLLNEHKKYKQKANESLAARTMTYYTAHLLEQRVNNVKRHKKKLNETIKKDGDKWAVYNKSGTKKLGTHKTKKQAQDQLAAIEISKKNN